MFFLASPTQFSHSFPLPQHTATSHTPWAQLTHRERRWESFRWATTPPLRDKQCDCFSNCQKNVIGRKCEHASTLVLFAFNEFERKKRNGGLSHSIFSRFRSFRWPTFVRRFLCSSPSHWGRDEVGLTGCGVGFISLHRERQSDSFKKVKLFCYQQVSVSAIGLLWFSQ